MVEPLWARDVETEEPDWLWKQRIARKVLHLVAGRPDQSKGLWICHLAAHISNQTYISRRTGKPRRGQVIYSAQEDLPGLMTRPRLEAAGANLGNIDLSKWRIPSCVPELAQVLYEREVDLLVFDPVVGSLDHGINRFTDRIREATEPLHDVIKETGTAVLFVDHVTKKIVRSSFPLQAIGGNGSGLAAEVRMAFLFGKDPKDEGRRILSTVKHNIRDRPRELEFELDTNDIEVRKNGKAKEIEVPCLVYKGECDYDPMDFLINSSGKGAGGRLPKQLADATEWLTNYLYHAGQPVKASAVAEDARQRGMSRPTLWRAAQQLGIIRDPPKGGRNCVWSLNPELAARYGDQSASSMEVTDDVIKRLLDGDR